jgi:hypothetical protein
VRRETMARTILVPLNIAMENAAVLDVVGELARAENATVRLMHVARCPKAVLNDDGKVVVYAHQEALRVEHQVKASLKSLAGCHYIYDSEDQCKQWVTPEDAELDLLHAASMN